MTDITGSFQRYVPPEHLRERYQGCLLGGAVGDALGAPVEFMRRSEILKRFGEPGITDMVAAYGKVGAITDDTQMTLFTAEGALRACVRADVRGMCHPPSVIHAAYLRWLHTQHADAPTDRQPSLDGWLIEQPDLHARRAPGRTCIDALRTATEIGAPAHNTSKGCGGVMRVAPIGMLFHALAQADPALRSAHFKQAFELGCEAAALTHGHPTGFLTAGVMAALIFELLDGHPLPSAIEAVRPLLEARPDHAETLEAIRHAQSLHTSNLAPHAAIRALGEGWIAEEALAIGLYCALKADTLESAVVVAVNHDGDSDSTGLIAGHLMGAIQGRSAIPARWLAPLELREVIEAVADDLATVGRWRIGDWEDEQDPDAQAYYFRRYPA